MLCSVDHGRHGAEEGGKRLAAEQVGMQPLPARYADEWVVRVQVVGAGQGGGGQSSAALLHPERWSQKWQSDVIHRHTQAGAFKSFQPAQ